jgi:WD40 repeat protein
VPSAEGWGYWLITGSRDCTVGVWLLHLDEELPMDVAPTHVLFGHEDSVTAVAVHQELDVVISGSDDGLVLIHTLREGLFLRSVTVGVAVPSALMSAKSPGSSAAAAAAASAVATGGDGAPLTPPRSPPRPSSEALAAAEQLSPAWSERSGGYGRSRSQSHNIGGSSSPLRHSVTLICIAAAGEPFFVVYSADGHRLFSFHINGRLVTALSAGERLYSLCASEDGKVLVSGGRRGLIVLRWFTSLKLANDQGREGLDAVVDGSAGAKAFSSPVRSLFFTAKEQHLVVGLESGHMRIMTNDSEYLRVQLHSRLQRTGFLR